MICEQLVYGLFSETGYKTIQTPGIKQLLSKQSIQQLKALRLPYGKDYSEVQMHFKTEDTISVTVLKRTKDKYGREGIINHTIVMKTSDYLSIYPPIRLVKNCFITDYNSPPSLQPIIIE